LNNSPFVFDTYFTSNEVKKAVIALHGYSGNEHSMRPVAIGARLKNVQWYFPRAPYPMENENEFTWFSGSDEMGWKYKKSVALLNSLVENIHNEKKLDYCNIYIVGFSQGACLAMEAGLRLPLTLGGIIPIAGFIKYSTKLKADITSQSIATPLLLLHGLRDTIVKPESSRTSKKILTDIGLNVKLEEYDASHKIPITAYPLIRHFISENN